MKRLFLILALFVGLSTACTPVLPYAATVNGQEISVTTLNDELHTVLSNPRYSSILDQSLSSGSGASGLQPGGANTVNSDYVASQLLFNRVLVALIDQTVKDDHIVVSDAQRQAAEQLVRLSFRGGTTDDSMFNSLPASYQAYLVDRQASLTAIIESRERPYYDQHPDEFANYCISHILVTDQTKAEDIRKQIVNGGDFAALAKANSIDTGSASNGGSLDCVSAAELNSFVQPFADAVKQLQVGQISPLVQTQYGYHIIKVTKKEQLSFTDAKRTLDQVLNNDFFTKALDAAHIKVNPRYGTFVAGDAATNQQANIVPPASAGLTPATTTSTTLFDPSQYQTVPDTSGEATPETTE